MFAAFIAETPPMWTWRFKALLKVYSSPSKFLAFLAAFVLALTASLFAFGAGKSPSGHTGQALSLQALLHPGLAQSHLAQAFRQNQGRWTRAANGRFVYSRHAAQYQRKPHAAGNGTVVIDEPVQTFDVFLPPPAFAPSDGPLTPTNSKPVWSADGSYFVFSSNRPSSVTTDPANHFHIWFVSSGGDNAGSPQTLTQITSGSGNEFDPALNSSNNALTFTSDAQSPGVQNLYTTSFPLQGGAVDPATLISLTINRNSPTGFSNVSHPTWSPDSARIAFAGLTTTGATKGFTHIYFLYTATGGYLPSGAGSNPPAKLSDGMTNDADPTWSADGAYIFFDSTAANIVATGSPIAPNPTNPAAETTPSATSGGDGHTRSIFAIFPNGTNGIKVTNAAQTTADDSFPALRTEADGRTVDLAFARQVTGSHSKITFVLGTYNFDPNTNSASTPVENNTQTLNSSDSANAFDDTQPVWSPVTTSANGRFGGSTNTTTVNSIAYVSNRTITYNDPNTNAPLEQPVSLARGTFGVGANYSGILQSQIDQINPPTLLPYSGNEVIHVTDTKTDTPRRNGDIQPGQKVQFTVRLSSREAGVDNNNVYIQIKDPDSKYQDADRLEHKVFTTDTFGADSGSATRFLYNANASFLNPANTETGFFGYTKIGNDFYPYPFYLFGVPAGFDAGNTAVSFYRPNGPAGSPITVGHLPPGDLTDPPANPNPVKYSNPNAKDPKPLIPLPGGSPFDFSVSVNNGTYNVGMGQEYEAQYLNARFGINGGSGGSPAAQASDYGTPYYLAGLDDQGAHAGAFRAPRSEWLKLTPVVTPDANGNGVPDTNGGILYTATWITPTSPSDFYLDVIAYDKATDAAFGGPGANFRIYDNVWGFSTQPFSGINDILVVSDNALGQKFAATTFSGNVLSGLRPLFFGAESYMTDIDVNLLPNAVFQYMFPTGTKNQYTSANGSQFGTYPDSYGTGTNDPKQDQFPSPIAIPLYQGIPVLNGLGVGSYNEDRLDGGRPGPVSQDETTIDGRSAPKSQQYSLWRILARGPIPQIVVNAYAPSFVAQPAVNDTAKPGINGNPSPFTAPAATVPSAQRCVVWVSPFTGDLPLNQGGSLADPATQQTIENFLKIGGRIFVTGQDVGSAITLDGSVNNAPAAQGSPGNFLPDFLSAGLVSSNSGTQTLAGATGQGKRITSDAFVNVSPSTFGNAAGFNTVNMFFPELETDRTSTYVPPGNSPLYLGNNYEHVVGPEAQWRADGSLDQLGPVVQPFGGSQVLAAIDTLTPFNGAHVDITSGGASSLIYNENTATGSRVVYAGFGLEGLGTEYYKVAETNPIQVQYVPRNLRQNILHNIVCYLRTGTFKGQVVNGGGGGGGVNGGVVAGATVYLAPDRGVALPNGRQTFSAITDSRGNYTISGVEPGSYTVVAYKQGFNRSVVGVGNGGFYNSALPFAVEGDTTTTVNLNLTPAPKGSIAGKITDGKGAPINGATVTFVSTDGQYTITGTSGVDGTYTISAVTPDDYTGTASDAPNFGTSASQAVTVAASQAVGGINFVLPPGPGTLGGLVKDVNGNPVSGATISITDASGNAVDQFTTTTLSTPAKGTTGDGSPLNYSGTLPAGQYLVSASLAGFTTTRAVAVTIKTVAFTRQDFTLSPGPGVLGGLVTDQSNNKPITGALVTLTDTNGKPVTDSNGNPVGPFTTTAPTTPAVGPTGDGQPLNFQGSVPPGTYLATASAFGFTTSQPVSVTITQGNFTRVPTAAFALVSSIGTVGGLVTDKASGKPLAGATVTVLDSAGKTVATAQTTAMPSSPASPDGDTAPLNYTVRLVAGSYTLTVTAAGHAQVGPAAFTITASTFVRKDAALSATPGTLGGLVTARGSSQPLAGVTVTVTDANGNPVKDANGNAVGPFTTSGTASAPAAPTGDSSSLNYSGSVPPGTYLVNFTAPNSTSPPATTVTVVTNAFVRADAILTPAPGALAGLVKNGTGALIGGAAITVSDSNGNVVTTLTSAATASATTAAGADGNPANYQGPLLPGTYSVTVTAAGYVSPAAVTVTLTSGSFVRKDFVLTSSLGTLGGLVTDPVSGQALSGALVSVTNSTGKVVATATTAATATSPASPQGDGQPLNYSLPLSQGTYNVTVTARGYTAPPAKTVTLTVGGFTRADFTGSSGFGTIHLFPAGLNFFSVPYNYNAAGIGFDALLGTLNSGTISAPSTGSNRSHIYVYNPAQLQYVLDPTAPADAPRLGQGYWVYLLNAHAVTTPAPAASTTSIAVGLKAGWNMIGVPSLQAVSVSGTTGLHFANAAGGATLDFATATSNAYRLVSGTLYSYNGTGYVPVTAGGTMQPWQAYWIYVYADTTVLIPTGS